MSAEWQGLSGSELTGEIPAGGEGDRKFVVALARGLEVLHCFRVRDGFLGNQEIAERTGLAKPTVTRLTYTLCQLGYLRHNTRTGKYQLAPGAVTLGYAALANLGIRHVAREHMERAADRLGAPVGLGVLYRNTALYVGMARGKASFSVQLDVGSRVPLPTSAIGRALLVAMDDGLYEEQIAALPRFYGDSWTQVLDAVEQAKLDYKRDGFVVSAGDWRSDVHAVGVPLIAADGSGIYGFNCGAPPHHFPLERLRSEVGPAIAKMCNVVDHALGGAPERRGDWSTMDIGSGG